MTFREEARQHFEDLLDGSISLETFETWLYDHSEAIPELIGDEAYLDLVSIDLTRHRAIGRVRRRVAEVLDSQFPDERSQTSEHEMPIGPVDRRPDDARVERMRADMRDYYEQAPSHQLRVLARRVPDEMRAGSLEEGEVHWRLAESTVTSREVAAFESALPLELPDILRAYLFAYCHGFSQVRSDCHDQLVMVPPMPWVDPLKPLRDLVGAWQPLIGGGFVPLAQWGDGWGPLCLDAEPREHEHRLVWFDHEELGDLDDWPRRSSMLAHAHEVYYSYRGFVEDVFETYP